MALAKNWYDRCFKAHKSCERPSAPPPLPTRVIEIDPSDDNIRLQVTNGKTGHYAALSHCWGGKNPLTTTTATLQERKTIIEFGESSKTFKDAVSVTKQLGIGYLWVDSLCIIQDSKYDWAIEAAKMSEIYNNATVTISANVAADSSQGLFADTKDRKRLNKTFELACKGADGQPSCIYVRRRHGDPFSIEKRVHSTVKPEQSRLVTRGWVLQEELLSPRILHFNKEEMSWTCSTYSRCECRIRPAQPPPHPFRALPGVGAPSSPYNHELDLEWPFIVMEFTRRNLTCTTDRIVVMSGLAGWMYVQTDRRHLFLRPVGKRPRISIALVQRLSGTGLPSPESP